MFKLLLLFIATVNLISSDFDDWKKYRNTDTYKDELKTIEERKKRSQSFQQDHINDKKKSNTSNYQVDRSENYRPAYTYKNSILLEEQKNIREKAFTKWMSPKKYQSFFKSEEAKDKFPAYIELNQHGQRRMLLLQKPKDMKYTAKSSQSFQDFKKWNATVRMRGRVILSHFTIKVDGITFHSTIWIDEQHYNNQRLLLQEYGIVLKQ